MITATAWSTSEHTTDAVTNCYEKLELDLSGKPDWMVVYCSVTHDKSKVVDIIKSLAPDVPVHGGTSCQGIMTASGFHSEEGTGFGLFGLRDPSGSYSVGAVESGNDPRVAGSRAIRKALDGAGRPDESPKLIWLTCAPGYEEDVIQGIEEVLGEDIPIAGGSSADNTIEGNWWQMSNGRSFKDGVIVSALYPSTKIHYAFWSGYYPTEKKGKITSCDKRVIKTIDGRPAAGVYNEWTGGAIEDSLEGGTILGSTTLHPIGRSVKQMGELNFYCLTHPESVTDDGGLKVFTDINPDEEIVLMTSSCTRLVGRAGVVARSALRSGMLSPEKVAGGLVIFCAGCMLTVQGEMDKVVKNISETLGDNPFLGAFTFGEQGALVDGANHHGNLMVSVVLFERR